MTTQLADALLRHFDAHRRDLPWRGTDDAYAIWVSEVMLQQTRVDTVRPYFERWLRRFPDVESLAEAELADVLRLWEGLGYYSRARNLHRAAGLVRERHGGVVPREPDALRALPGVGEYTAGAVASIAYGVPVPAVDGNVRRVLARIHDLPDPTPGQLRELAVALVPAHRPGDFNQALMELGATVCTPRSPDCDACPLAGWCAARLLGVQEDRPRRRRRGPLPESTVDTLVLVREGATFLVLRPEDGLLGGLWEFPGDAAPAWVAEAARSAVRATPLQPIRHVFSHRIVTYRPTLYEEVRPGGEGTDGARWVPLDRLEDFALPVAQRKVASAVRARLDGVGKPPTGDSGRP